MAAPDRSVSGGVSVLGAVDAAPLGSGRCVNRQVTVGTSDGTIALPTGTWRYVEYTILTADARVAIAIDEAATLGTSDWGVGQSKTGVSGAFMPTTPLVGGTNVLHAIASVSAQVELNLFKDAA